VRKRVENGRTLLLKGLDDNKDQSYFLCAVSEAQIARTLFPVGELEKPDVRDLAEARSLVTHDKKDSTGICFIGERRFSDFLQTYIPAQPGAIETPEGEVLGEHNGLMFHTLGQRQGLGIGGLKDRPEDPWYVAAKDLERNVLIVVQGNEHPLLFSRGLYCGEVDWVNIEHPTLPLSCTAKVRYRQPDQPCTLSRENGRHVVLFAEPQRAVTPGQSIVFYQEDVCLGGAIIEEQLR
jgi:tRNA-specific 2-thiouridylase